MNGTENTHLDSMSRQFIKKVPMLMAIVDQEGGVIDCNDSLLSTTGFNKIELSSLSTIDATSGGNEPISQILRLCDDMSFAIREKEVWIRKKDGSSFPGILTAVCLENTDAKRVYGIAIAAATNLIAGRDNAERISKDLLRKENMKDEFIAIASHELRTPIQPILGLALLAKKGKISQDEAWESVLKEARRLQQLANDILDVSRIESGSLTYTMTDENLAELLESVVKTIGAGELAREVDIRLVIDDELRRAVIRMDRSRITQVMSNIIGNAVKFTCKGTVTVEARSNKEKSRIEVSVTDTGGGIPESILPSLFKKFITRSVGQAERHGSGLGLYICKAIINAHNGIIYVYNNEKGATFVIHLLIVK